VQLAPGAKATGEELVAFAAAHIPERAAAPKEVHVLEAMPLTDVQKPSKVHLRYDSAQRVFAAVLGEAAGTQARVEVEGRPSRNPRHHSQQSALPARKTMLAQASNRRSGRR